MTTTSATTTETSTVTNANGRSNVVHIGTRSVVEGKGATAWGVPCGAGLSRGGRMAPQWTKVNRPMTCARCAKTN